MSCGAGAPGTVEAVRCGHQVRPCAHALRSCLPACSSLPSADLHTHIYERRRRRGVVSVTGGRVLAGRGVATLVSGVAQSRASFALLPHRMMWMSSAPAPAAGALGGGGQRLRDLLVSGRRPLGPPLSLGSAASRWAFVFALAVVPGFRILACAVFARVGPGGHAALRLCVFCGFAARVVATVRGGGLDGSRCAGRVAMEARLLGLAGGRCFGLAARRCRCVSVSGVRSRVV